MVYVQCRPQHIYRYLIHVGMCWGWMKDPLMIISLCLSCQPCICRSHNATWCDKDCHVSIAGAEQTQPRLPTAAHPHPHRSISHFTPLTSSISSPSLAIGSCRIYFRKEWLAFSTVLCYGRGVAPFGLCTKHGKAKPDSEKPLNACPRPVLMSYSIVKMRGGCFHRQSSHTVPTGGVETPVFGGVPLSCRV